MTRPASDLAELPPGLRPYQRPMTNLARFAELQQALDISGGHLASVMVERNFWYWIALFEAATIAVGAVVDVWRIFR